MTTAGSRITSVRRTVRQQSPEVQHDDPLGEAEHRLHHVLDPDHGDAEPVTRRAHDLDRGVQLGVVEPGHHLVEQQQPGPAGEGAGELEEPLLVEVQRADVVVAAAGEARRTRVPPRPGRTPPTRSAGRRPRRTGRRARRSRAPSSRRTAAASAAPWRSPPGGHGAPRAASTSAPAKRIVPPVGGSSPLIAFSSVLLPAPFGPTRARISPSSTSSVTPPTAGRPPKDFSTRIQLEDRHVASSDRQGSYGSSGSARISVSGYHSPASLTPSGAGPGPITENSGCAAAISPHSVQLRSHA